MKRIYIFFISITLIFNLISLAEASCGSSNCFLHTGSQEGTTSEGRFVVDLSYRYIPQEK